MEGILDFSKEFDINLLDSIVNLFYGNPAMNATPEHAMAGQVLAQFQDHPESWTKVDAILERSQSLQTKFIACQILEKLINTRWKILPDNQRQGIRNFIVETIIKISAKEEDMQKEKFLLNKLNMVLVQILKQEWPHNWPNFIPEIVASSKTSLSLCENNMVILKLLSEEIFDYSAEQMTQAKTKNLKKQMCGEFSEIFQLCREVLQKAQKPSLIVATLETLLRFLNWIPLGYIFETDLIEMLRNRFLEVPAFRNTTLKCLTEIGGLSVEGEYPDKFIVLFTMTIASINTMIPSDTDIAAIFESSTNEEQDFIQNLALFLTSFLSSHLKLIENLPNKDPLLNAHYYLIKISAVDEREIFKICLEYWAKLVTELYEEIQQQPIMDMPLLSLTSAGSTIPPSMLASIPVRKHIYHNVLSNLRIVMIERMVKPEEVLVVENDEGEIVREFVKETDTITLYKGMREVLVYLTHLDVIDTENIMSEKLAKQMDGTEWSWNNLNKLCWAIGSISGAMNEETEKRFLVTVIKDLLGLCEMKRGKGNKAVVASNIMYVVGQYPRFLKAHWKFLKTVVNKNFEFMHESHEGVQDMACDTFLKIAQKCRRHFVVQQSGESMPFIEEILSTMDKITSDLQPQQVHTVFEAIGYMISAQPNKNIQQMLIEKFMAMPNSAWDGIMRQAQQSIDILNNPETVKVIANVLKTNVSACSSVGPGFYVQIERIYMDMLGLYKAVSQLISDAITQQPDVAMRTPRVRGLRTVKKEILKLVDTYVMKADEPYTQSQVIQNLIPPLMEAVLGDYAVRTQAAREAEVLNMFADIVNKLGSQMTDNINVILDSVFQCTLEMITKDFTEYPEHRMGFYRLLRSINSSCFPALLNLPPQQFKLFLDSVVWAFKHTMRDIADIGLSITLELINNFTIMESNISNIFYQTYFLSILQDVFFVLTDSDHKSGFKMQSTVLARLFEMVQKNEIQAPLFDPAQVPDPSITNKEFLREYVINLLRNAFPHLNIQQITVFVEGLFVYNNDLQKFKLHIRDFLIQLKEFAGDTTELFLEEKEAEFEAKKKAEMEKAFVVPGLIKPSEMDDDMD